MIHVYQCFTKPLCEFVDISAHGTSNAQTTDEFWIHLPNKALVWYHTAHTLRQVFEKIL